MIGGSQARAGRRLRSRGGGPRAHWAASSVALVACAALAAALGTGANELERAAERLSAGAADEARTILIAHLQRHGADAAAHALLADASKKLGRADEAAHHYEVAYELTEAAGDERTAKELLRKLYGSDPNARSRRVLFERITARGVEAAENLAAGGSRERALLLLESLGHVATGRDAERVRTLLAELRKAQEQVDLDAASGGGRKPGEWPEHEAKSARYDLRCHLEPEVVQLIGETMDHVFAYYVDIYFDGDEKKIAGERATIVIHPTREKMHENWGGSSAPEGWWSPGTREVVAYDTRTTSGTLSALMETLFHEASHQFMTLLEAGGNTPAWLNEGTASFFEGAVAMADNRVLWPDAALGRLMGLAWMLEKGSGPQPIDVIRYDEPASYPAEYYPFGWGFVYFLQQYEDPQTLEYVYRPLYAEYRDEIVKRGGNPFTLFEQVFLGRKSPRGHEDFAAFEADWRKWILEFVKPLHAAPENDRRVLRLAEVERYVAAADRAKEERKPKVAESELLARALGHLEYVRTKIDGADAPDGELILRQAHILERLGFEQSVAPLLESWLDLVDEGLIEDEAGLYAELEKRLARLDSKNHALRAARSKMRDLAKNAKLLADKVAKTQMPLRTYTLYAAFARLFDDEEMRARADEAMALAREAGSLLGSVVPLSGEPGQWKSVFSGGESRFEAAADAVEIASLRPAGRVCTALQPSGEFELRATIDRGAKVMRGSFVGLIVSGGAESDWWIVGLDDSGSLAAQVVRVAGGGTSLKRLAGEALTPPVAEGEAPLLRVRARPGESTLEVAVGERPAVRIVLPEPLPSAGHPGVFVKDAEVRFLAPVLEIFP